jgi:hypothetical protein
MGIRLFNVQKYKMVYLVKNGSVRFNKQFVLFIVGLTYFNNPDIIAEMATR